MGAEMMIMCNTDWKHIEFEDWEKLKKLKYKWDCGS